MVANRIQHGDHHSSRIRHHSSSAKADISAFIVSWLTVFRPPWCSSTTLSPPYTPPGYLNPSQPDHSALTSAALFRYPGRLKLFMSMGWLLLGGLSVLSMNGPRWGWDWRNPWALAGKDSFEQVRSAGMFFMFMVVLVIIAYFTNPNEASFRTFLTELTFRRHLSQLHNPVSGPGGRVQNSTATVTLHKGRLGKLTEDLHAGTSEYPESTSNSPSGSGGLRFSNRAAVSFRTGPHIVRSFGLFSIGIITPIVNPCSPGEAIAPARSSVASTASSATLADESATTQEDFPGWWIIGAFGTWWLGGALVHSPKRKPSEKERCKDGKNQARVISVHSMDRIEPSTGIVESPTVAISPPPNGDVLRPKAHPSRPSTPPPLPKSASLPLHAQRTPPNTKRQQDAVIDPNLLSPSKSPSLEATPLLHASLQVPSPSQPTDSPDPSILELLAQIKDAESSVSDLQSQIYQAKASSAEAHEALNISVEQQRERKRADDADKKEIKARTKALDDSRRQAENARKEAEKKLRGIQAARDGAVQKKSRLEREIRQLKDAVNGHTAKLTFLSSGAQAKAEEAQTEVHQRKIQIKVKEGEVASLSSRAQVLEQELKLAEARLKRVKEEDQQKQARAKAEAVAKAAHAMFERQMQQHQQAQHASPFRGGVPQIHTRPHMPHFHSSHPHQQPSLFERRQATNHTHPRNASGPISSSRERSPSQENRSRSLSLKSVQSAPQPPVQSQTPLSSATASAIAARAKGYAIFNQDIAACGSSSGLIAPGDRLTRTYSQGDAARFQLRDGLLSPAAASYLPSNLLADHSPRFPPDEDHYFQSPVSSHFGDSAGHGADEHGSRSGPHSANDAVAGRNANWFGVDGHIDGLHTAAGMQQARQALDAMVENAAKMAFAGLSSFDKYNEQRATLPRHDAPLDGGDFFTNADGSPRKINIAMGDGKRRWFSTKKATLNPDAKVFTPPFMASTASLPQPLTSRLMPWRAGSSQPPIAASLFSDLSLGAAEDTPSFFSSLRAFQPSADELKALSGNPANRSRETVNSFGSGDIPSPSSIYAPGLPHIPGPPSGFPLTSAASRPVSGNNSQISLDQTMAAAWESSGASGGATGETSPTTSRRPFGRFWSRSSKESNDPPAQAQEGKGASLGPIERPSKASKPPLFVEEKPKEEREWEEEES